MFSSEMLMTLLFVLGYFFITIEHYTHINKAGIALLMAVLCWVVQFGQGGSHAELEHHVAEISEIVFFILGALAIVELISSHKGFKLLTRSIRVGSKKQFLWVICMITFFLSAVLDNLTTTIVMVSLLKKLIPKGEDRLILGSGVVIAANAGGAWTPIGDVTTTMLWIGGQISTLNTLATLILPSLACAFVSNGILSRHLEGTFEDKRIEEEIEPRGTLIFFMGIGLLMFVPVFKMLTGLPPFMGVLLGLGLLWLMTDLLHKGFDERRHLKVPDVLSKIDLSGALFFLGILLAVGALDAAGILSQLAVYMNHWIPNLNFVAIALGLISAVVDNVPLVAASMSMYSMAQFPQDHFFWQLIAFAAGTGGSILVIGSAAGVVYMGLEKVDFFWYMRKISPAAFFGFLAGIALLFFQNFL